MLFIDEAYSLSDDQYGGDSFGREAIATIVKEMDDRRGRVSVIAAGYEDRMDRFLKANPGLSSRFDDPVRFPHTRPTSWSRSLRRKPPGAVPH